jgi:putative tricarboxylic transport membrane protein
MNDRDMAKADFVTALILIVASLTILVLSIQMPRMEELGANPYSAPGIVPGFIGAILLLLSGILFGRSILRQGYRLELNGSTVRIFFQNQSVRRIFLTILLSLIYGLGLLGRIPYIVATFLYVACFVFLFEYQRGTSLWEQRKMLIFAIVQAILVTGGVAAVFRYLFLVKLP